MSVCVPELLKTPKDANKRLPKVMQDAAPMASDETFYTLLVTTVADFTKIHRVKKKSCVYFSFYFVSIDSSKRPRHPGGPRFRLPIGPPSRSSNKFETLRDAEDGGGMNCNPHHIRHLYRRPKVRLTTATILVVVA